MGLDRLLRRGPWRRRGCGRNRRRRARSRSRRSGFRSVAGIEHAGRPTCDCRRRGRRRLRGQRRQCRRPRVTATRVPSNTAVVDEKSSVFDRNSVVSAGYDEENGPNIATTCFTPFDGNSGGFGSGTPTHGKKSRCHGSITDDERRHRETRGDDENWTWRAARILSATVVAPPEKPREPRPLQRGRSGGRCARSRSGRGACARRRSGSCRCWWPAHRNAPSACRSTERVGAERGQGGQRRRFVAKRVGS